ncbi:MAG: pyridoxamine 5'-phosphate oxidase family protein [bacterium]
MATWADFADSAPDLAERGARLLGVGVAYIATTARDGSARVHPFTPLIGGGRLLAFIGKHTVKYGNLRRDPRYAIHAMLGKDDEEFLIMGRAVVSDDWATSMLAAVEARKINMTSRDHIPFEFMLERVHWAIWEGLGTPDIRRRSERWEEPTPSDG